MKIAASDFDGTLSYKTTGISAADLDAIHRWQAAGNKFGLVTGRNLDFVKHGLRQVNLTLDFCVCVNGAAAFDAANRLLFADAVKADFLVPLFRFSASVQSPHIAFLQPEKTFVCCRDEEASAAFVRDLPVTKITADEIPHLSDIVQISFSCKSPEQTTDATAEINRSLQPGLFAIANQTFVDVTAVGNDKGNGLAKLLRCLNWDANPVYAIGDNINDLPMIDKFGGFTVATGRDEVKKRARKIYASVGEMLRDAEK